MPPAGHAAGVHGGGHKGGGAGGGHKDQGADFLDFKRSHEYNWNRLVWAHGWSKIHSGGPKAAESSWKYLPPNGRYGPGAVEGRDFFATLDEVMAFCKKAGPGGMPSSRVGHTTTAAAAANAAPAVQLTVPASAADLVATAALAERGKGRVEGMSRRQRLEAVFLAAFEGDAALLAALVKADKSLLKAEAEGDADGEDDGATPLLVAARRGHAECVRVLLDEGPAEMVKQVDAKGRSALHAAARGDHAHVARLLVERGLKPVFRRPDEGHTPLMVCARHNAGKVARFLLTECGPTPRAPLQMKIRNNQGENAYMLAVRHGSSDVAQLLLQAGAEPIIDHRGNKKERQAEHKAAAAAAAAIHPQPPPPQQQQQRQLPPHCTGNDPTVESYRSEFGYVEQAPAPPPPPPPVPAPLPQPQQRPQPPRQQHWPALVDETQEDENDDDDDGPYLTIPSEAEAGPALAALNAKLLRAAIAVSLGLDPRPHLGLPALPARRRPTRQPAAQKTQQPQQQQQQPQQRAPPPPPPPQPPRPAAQQQPPAPAPIPPAPSTAAARPQQQARQQPTQQAPQPRSRSNSTSNGTGNGNGRAAAPAPAASSSLAQQRAPVPASVGMAGGVGWQEDKASHRKSKKEAKRRQELLGRLSEEELHDVPDDLVCPISMELLSEGVVCEDGYTYQRKEFEKWVTRCESEGRPLTSPMTRQPVSPIWFPNRSIRQRVEEFLLNQQQQKNA